MKTLLIIGAAGFIGSNFLNLFVKKNPDIRFVVVDSLTYAGKLSNISEDVQGCPNYFFEKCDIRFLEDLQRVYKKYSPTDVIHFAAESHVDNSIKNPSIFVETNVLGTQNLLNLHREFGLNRFHHISTDEVYGHLGDDPSEKFSEKTPLDPRSPYSASKAASDLLVQASRSTYGLDTVITRCSNNYGPNQDKEKLIPHSLDLLFQGKNIALYGDGRNVRDWLYVTDHCEAIWRVFHGAPSGELYTIGGNDEKTNGELAAVLLKKLGLGDDRIDFVEDRLGHDRRYAIDAQKIQRELGWVPQVSFEEGIEKTIMFYQRGGFK